MALAAARAAAWPLLVVAAAAYGRAPPLQCLAAYLGATLARIQPVGALACSAALPCHSFRRGRERVVAA